MYLSGRGEKERERGKKAILEVLYCN